MWGLLFICLLSISCSPALAEQQAVQQAELLFIRLKPQGKGTTQESTEAAAVKWLEDIKAHVPGLLDLSVVTRELLIAEVQGKEAALKVKDALLELQQVHEVQEKRGEVFRRPGDPSLQELRKRAAKGTRSKAEAGVLGFFKKWAQSKGVTVDKQDLRKLSQKLKKHAANKGSEL